MSQLLTPSVVERRPQFHFAESRDVRPDAVTGAQRSMLANNAAADSLSCQVKCGTADGTQDSTPWTNVSTDRFPRRK